MVFTKDAAIKVASLSITPSLLSVVCFRAKTFIRKGDEITINYVPPHVETMERRSTLKEGWYFDCTCPRCSDPGENGAMTSALKCQDCPDGFSLPVKSIDPASNWQCGGCGAVWNNELAADQMAKVKALIGAADNDVDSIIAVIDEARTLVHPHHAVLTELRSRIIPVMSKRYNGQPMTETYDLKRKLCLENMAVMNIVDPGLSASRGKLMFELQSCLFDTAQASFLTEKIDEREFGVVLTECKRILAEASRCLNNESKDSVNNKYEKFIKNASISMTQILDSMQRLKL